MKRLTSTSLLAALALASAAAAQPAPGARGPALSLPDFQARFVKRLMQADANHDGKISLEEWLQWRTAHSRGAPGNPEAGFVRMDANHDGFLTPDELQAMAARRYARRQAVGTPTAPAITPAPQ